MKKVSPYQIVQLIAFFLLICTVVLAQEATRPNPLPLWSNGAPSAKGTTPEDIPTISIYRPPTDKANGAAIVVCPGGGYGRLADHEGHTVAVWLNQLGVTAIVLKYRLGPRYGHPAPLLDVARAIRTVRANSKEWGVEATRIGVWGFSAGGHLASTIATHFDAGNPQATDPIDRVSSRPDLVILAYPVISMVEGITHAGSRKNLLGTTPDPELVTALSNDRQVTAQTPPTFLFHTADDGGVNVENSLLFAEALRKAKVPYELHVFEKGPHGVGLAQNNPALSIWPKLLENWLRVRGFIKW
jgi:acetyl esterase/lipase